MNLSRYEMETIISYNDEEKTASVYTHNRSLLRKLAAMAEERPDECKLIRTNHEELAAEYIIPKRWVKVRMTRILTDEQMQAARDRAATYGFGRKSNGNTDTEDEDDDGEEELADDE